jgi:hypothetical protein
MNIYWFYLHENHGVKKCTSHQALEKIDSSNTKELPKSLAIYAGK